MRSTRLLFAACLLASVTASLTSGCSNNQPTTSPSDASIAAQDGSSAPCTSMGGVCIPYTTSCPVLQQNATLCGDSVMLCCLPADDAGPIIPPEDSGEGPSDSSTAPEVGE
jgi:hypothetical protein